MIQEMPALMKFLGGFPKLTRVDSRIDDDVLVRLGRSGASNGSTKPARSRRRPEVFEGYKAIAANSPVRYSVSPMVDYLDQRLQFLAPYGRPGAVALESRQLLSFYAVKIVADGSPSKRVPFKLSHISIRADRG